MNCRPASVHAVNPYWQAAPIERSFKSMPGVPATKGTSASVGRGAASLARSCSNRAASCLARFFGDPAKSFAPSRVRTRVRTPTLRIHPGQVMQGARQISSPAELAIVMGGAHDDWGSAPSADFKNPGISYARTARSSLTAWRGVGGGNPIRMGWALRSHARGRPQWLQIATLLQGTHLALWHEPRSKSVLRLDARPAARRDRANEQRLGDFGEQCGKNVWEIPDTPHEPTEITLVSSA